MAKLTKGVNPQSGGLSKASLEALSPEVRAKYQDNGLLLDGTVDNSPLEYLYPESPIKDDSSNGPEEKEPSIPVSQLDSYIEKKLAEKMASLSQSQPQAQAAPQAVQSISVQDATIDDIPEVRNWEFKDRTYVMADGSTPSSTVIRDRHKGRSPLQYFHPEKKEQFALMYSESHHSLFVKNHGDVKPQVTHIVMLNGVLTVPKENTKLQKFLEIHPDKGIVFKELDTAAEARKQIQAKDLKFNAEKLIREADFTKQKAVARVMCPNFSESWLSDELRHYLLAEVEKSPSKAISLVNDKMIEMKGIIKTAQHRGHISFKDLRWATDEGEVIIQVAPDADEVAMLADHFNGIRGRDMYTWLDNKVR